MVKNLLISTLLGTSVLLAGCTTITGTHEQTISINSNPIGANYVIQDETGKVIQKGITLQNITLAKHDSSYFGKKTYKIMFSKEGYNDSKYSLSTNPNGRYVLGNLFFCGLIGRLVVDPLNGGMYDITPTNVNQELNKQLRADFSALFYRSFKNYNFISFNWYNI